MHVGVFSTRNYDKEFLGKANHGRHELHYFESRLHPGTLKLTEGLEAVCVFVNDQLNAQTLQGLCANGVRYIVLRCTGFNNVDLVSASNLGVRVARVPAYSPDAVAEHTLGLILCLNRRIHRAHARVREGNFELQGLLGFDLCQRTIGLIGTGRIGNVCARIMRGIGCKVVAFDPYPNEVCLSLGVDYVSLEDLYAQSDVISLHCPLTPETHHLINDAAIRQMKNAVMLINTSRGGLIDTRAVIRGLKNGRIANLGIDVYEEEGDLFFRDLSSTVIQDDVFARLLTFPNVLITAHQGFFTNEALAHIAETTIDNLNVFESGLLPSTLVEPNALKKLPV